MQLNHWFLNWWVMTHRGTQKGKFPFKENGSAISCSVTPWLSCCCQVGKGFFCLPGGCFGSGRAAKEVAGSQAIWRELQPPGKFKSPFPAQQQFNHGGHAAAVPLLPSMQTFTGFPEEKSGKSEEKSGNHWTKLDMFPISISISWLELPILSPTVAKERIKPMQSKPMLQDNCTLRYWSFGVTWSILDLPFLDIRWASGSSLQAQGWVLIKGKGAQSTAMKEDNEPALEVDEALIKSLGC